MWVFFSLVSIPIVGVVAWLLYLFPLKNVPLSVRIAMAYAWLTSISIIAFIPVDVWATLNGNNVHPIYVMWEISFWSTQFLTWVGIPLFMGYIDSGAFDTLGKIWSSVRDNLMFYAVLLGLSFIGIMIVMSAGNLSVSALPGTCIALTNMFGLTVVVFLLGYGLVSFPRSTWRLSKPEAQLKQIHYDMGKLSMKVEESIAEMERVNFVVHTSQQQISRRDGLRPYIDRISKELMDSKPSGIELEKGDRLQDHIDRLTSQELDYALDERGLTELRRRVRNAANRFEGARTEYTFTVKHAMALSEICKRRQNKDYASDSDSNSGKLYWYALCIISPIVRRSAAVLFGLLSAIVVWSELVIVGERGYLSPIHLLMKSAHTEWAFYWIIIFPLAYMFFCTYHTLFNLAAFKFYHLIPKASPSYSLLLNGTLMCRFAAPLAYNFLHVIQIIDDDDDNSTAFSKVMGGMRVLPFFGTQFNSLLPILLLIHCILIFFDIWKKLSYQFIPARYQFDEEEFDDEHSNKGRLLLFKEQEAKVHGRQIGEVLGIGTAHSPTSIQISDPDRNLKSGHTGSASLDVPLNQVESGSVPGDVSEGGSRLDNFFSSLTPNSSRRLLQPDQDSQPDPPKKSRWRWRS